MKQNRRNTVSLFIFSSPRSWLFWLFLCSFALEQVRYPCRKIRESSNPKPDPLVLSLAAARVVRRTVFLAAWRFVGHSVASSPTPKRIHLFDRALSHINEPSVVLEVEESQQNLLGEGSQARVFRFASTCSVLSRFIVDFLSSTS